MINYIWVPAGGNPSDAVLGRTFDKESHGTTFVYHYQQHFWSIRRKRHILPYKAGMAPVPKDDPDRVHTHALVSVPIDSCEKK